MARKKKISKRVKIYNVVLISVLALLIISLVTVLCVVLFKNKQFYKIESRSKQIEKNKKADKKDYKTIGWVRVQGTNIDYPLYGISETSEEYPVQESLLWDLSYDGTYHNVMQLYGHNVTNLGPKPARHGDDFIRLEEMMSFVYHDFAKENKYFQVTIDGKDYLYKIFGVNFMEIDTLDSYSKEEYSEKEKKQYIDDIKNESIYDYDVEVSTKDDIASIVTCTRFFGNKSVDFLITGRLVREDEKVTNYSVLRNKNYEKVMDAMEGEEVEYEDEEE